MTDWPIRSASAAAIVRVIVSAPPPTATGTMIFSGLLGNGCAAGCAVATPCAKSAIAIENACRNLCMFLNPSVDKRAVRSR
jgi:hypothetical protein